MEPLSYEQTLRLRRLVARCALGVAPRVEIQALANELACEGVDDPALIDLLVEHDAWGTEVEALVRSFAQGRDIPWPSEEEAPYAFMRVIAEEVVALGRDPLEAQQEAFHTLAGHTEVDALYMADDAMDYLMYRPRPKLRLLRKRITQIYKEYLQSVPERGYGAEREPRPG